ncbi:hypothetical protein HBI56_005760 [Parastagonospora nodorum]|uniref:Cytochrome P450 n=1 Tax=Phaeosphaeria nodorum (strain SN15 / ATCC MYA-4574 / FGSC 10173) TaxID=321614 RepID=A0A7U2ER95_PHANO|nr:hypothetical protein HBH56_123910 [Parastagonospora nodorum]QRC91162.1 hypothetical protein JI435_300410 [Parastagonospora nodorum SN15]KAH3935033.1 hypothetical protein HBH54_049450 [Parastagonospora nodorum]KAH3950400.1 hypothetical protein HBH53_079910 [Parastagonospora nodorum]KAH3982591.1 hypothetical protein HBH51_037680 [Parastagonospora nodorum]
MDVFEYKAVVSTVVGLIVAWLLSKVAMLLKDRQRLKNMSGPPMHPLFGHIVSVAKTAMKLPTRAHPHVMMASLKRDYDLPGMFFVDARPASGLVLVVSDPDIDRYISDSGLDKHPSLGGTLESIAGKWNILTTDGAYWKKWRTVFNPGFSIQHTVSQVPVMVEYTESLVKILDEHASAERIFRLEEETTKITIDVIGKVICDHDFKSLTTDNEFMTTMRNTLSWMPDMQSINPFHIYHPLRAMFQKYYKYKMDKYIGKVLDERFAVSGAKQASDRKTRKKTGIDLALEEYFSEKGQDVNATDVTMDTEFRKAAIDNLLILLFAGHDTTASTLCYCYHYLQKYPHELTKVRAELDSVFGANTPAGPKLTANPYLVNQLEYTLAVIKEVLRLWTPGSSVRMGRKGFFLTDPKSGEKFDTDGLMIWMVSMATHRDAKIWGPDVDEFKPERFLPQNEGKVDPYAWRPFEKGPRNCIGQELALIEMKVVLAMTLREFDFKTSYEELGALMGDGTLWAKDASFRSGPMEVFGERMHQVLLAAGKPSEGMPCRVTKREM